MEWFLLLALVVAYLVLMPILLANARARIRTLERKVGEFELALDEKRSEPHRAAPTGTAAPEAAGVGLARVPASSVAPAVEPADDRTATAAAAGRAQDRPVPTPETAGGWKSPVRRPARPAPRMPSAVADALARARAWLLGGNTVARVGVVVLFFGVAFLLKYAAEQGWVPIEFRLAGAALGGLALLGVGWRLRGRRRNYGLVLQGGGAGIVYLSVFAAANLFELLPGGAAQVLMVVLVALTAALAVLQDARSLAALAMVGGFLAPVLISSGGSHVQLFAYYAVLDAGILAIAWFKAWRELNLIGFLFTFVIGGAWGYRFYGPEHFGTTEPFLVLFFLFYVAVPILFAERQPPRLKGYVDGSLVFGVPLVAFGLQSALVRDTEYGMALSALAAGLFYVVLATALWRHKPQHMRLLSESFLALAVAFGTLAIPLAVDGRWTGAAWALEGAALVWVGLRQERRLARWFGLLVQAGAGASLVASDGATVADTLMLNSFYVGAVLVALSALVSAYLVFRHRDALHESEAALSVPLLAWSLAWWYGAGVDEIWTHLATRHRYISVLGLVALTSAALSLLGRRLRWPDLARPPLLLVPVMAAVALAQTLVYPVPHFFAGWGWAVWVGAFAIDYWLLRRHQSEWSDSRVLQAWHSVTLWLAVFIAVGEVSWLVSEAVPGGRAWRYLVLGLVPALAVFALPRLKRRIAWPLQTYQAAYFDRGLPPLETLAALWLVHASFQAGNPYPLTYLPLLNPLEIAQALVLVIVAGSVLAHWSWAKRRDLWRGLMVLGFVVLNGFIARAVHFLADVPFDMEALWHSPRYQTAVSITWTIVALTAMVGGTRLRSRPAWIAGGVLLGAVVAKLFLVDLAGIGTVARIVSFIVVGGLILVIGFFSPLPPHPQEQDKAQEPS